jgi:urea transport system ATP-binding protein
MLDEPVAGMSVRERELTAELLKRICKEPLGDRDRARHGVRQAHRPQGHGAAPGKDPRRRASMEKVQNDPKVIDVYLGH